ncbi:MAG: hypothetical protein J3K34DRAFT_14297 [Monoraphidium minutum]|nr:MAG: hypothetical protein J3K34DRAFT_14297 [Monoraphidium minutum]
MMPRVPAPPASHPFCARAAAARRGGPKAPPPPTSASAPAALRRRAAGLPPALKGVVGARRGRAGAPLPHGAFTSKARTCSLNSPKMPRGIVPESAARPRHRAAPGDRAPAWSATCGVQAARRCGRGQTSNSPPPPFCPPLRCGPPTIPAQTARRAQGPPADPAPPALSLLAPPAAAPQNSQQPRSRPHPRPSPSPLPPARPSPALGAPQCIPPPDACHSPDAPLAPAQCPGAPRKAGAPPPQG